MVGEEGIEPSRAKAHRILSPARLPIPPLALIIEFLEIVATANRSVLYYN